MMDALIPALTGGARETTKSLLQRLQRHYIKPGHDWAGGVFIPECGINGPGKQARVDALYAGFTSTSGRRLIGHEIKVSRADWRKELDTSGKADFWADNCHAWYIVAPSIEIVPPEELPHGWGLMIPNPRTTTRMDVKVKAVIHANRDPSWDATRSILSRLDTLRVQREAEFERDAMEKARKKAQEQAAASRERNGGMTDEQSNRLATLDRLEKLLGSTVDPWTWRRDGNAISPEVAAAALRLASTTDDMRLDEGRYAADQIQGTVDRLLKGLAEWEDARTSLLALVKEA